MRIGDHALASLVLVLTLLAALSARPAPADWPQHRGPNGDGYTLGPDLLSSDGPIGLEPLWRRPLGTGYSGIVVSGELGATLYGDGEEDRLVVFQSTTGVTVWERSLGTTYRGHHGSDDGPISTPAISQGRVFALSPRGMLVACRLEDGELLWERQLLAESAPGYGFATSPIVVDDRLVLQAAGAAGTSLVAFRVEDGEEVWSTGESAALYQSAVLAELDGRRQVVGSDADRLFGVDPEGGEVLWRLEHGLGHEIALAQAVIHAGSSILLNSLDGAALFGSSGTELWRGAELKRSYTVPVLHEGRAFGFSGSFLVAIDLADGRVSWRSRRPGGGNLIAVGEHLAIFARDGRLVLAKAAVNDYLERSGTQALASGGVTAPSFAESTLFVRNLEEMAAVRIVPRETSDNASEEEAETPFEASGVLAGLVTQLSDADDPGTVVEAFLGRQLRSPIVEPDGRVHFLYRGSAEFVAVKGSVVGFDPSNEAHLPMHRLPRSDLWVATVVKDPKGHWEYVFEVDGTAMTDPRNPHVIDSIFGPASELRMPLWAAPEHVEPSTGPVGRLETIRFASSIRGDERELRVYLPPGYDDATAHYPLLLVNNGHLAHEIGRYDRSLDHLVGGRVLPLVAVFLPRNRSELGGPDTGDYGRMLAEELVPFLEGRYRLARGAEHRAIAGVGSGGITAAHTVLHHPDIFEGLAMQSAYFPSQDFAAELLAAGSRANLSALTAYVEWSRFDVQIESLGVDAIADTHEVAGLLEAGGASIRRNEVDGAPGWGSWRAQTDELLETLFPTSDSPR